MSEKTEYRILTEEKLESWDTVIYERRRFHNHKIGGRTVAVPIYELADIEDAEIDVLVRSDELCPGCLNWHTPEVLETCEADETGYKFDICRCNEAGDTPLIFGQYW